MKDIKDLVLIQAWTIIKITDSLYKQSKEDAEAKLFPNTLLIS